MKLAKQNGDEFQYRLSTDEALILRLLVRQFPLSAFSRVVISKTDFRAAEREKLLNESLAAHRNELKQKAMSLVGDDKFKTLDGHPFFCISEAGRETLLQILNDLRVECWRILGEPENLEMKQLEPPQEKIRHHQFMELAGYFEGCLLNVEDEPEQ
jgi:hypothetical protein